MRERDLRRYVEALMKRKSTKRTKTVQTERIQKRASNTPPQQAEGTGLHCYACTAWSHEPDGTRGVGQHGVVAWAQTRCHLFGRVENVDSQV